MKKIIDMAEKVKSYEEACAIDGITPLTLEHFSFLPEPERKGAYSTHRLETIHRVFHQGRMFDWNDYNQPKFQPAWDMGTYEGEPGSGFALAFVYDFYVHSDVGSRLCSFSREEAEYIYKQFIEDYKNIMK